VHDFRRRSLIRAGQTAIVAAWGISLLAGSAVAQTEAAPSGETANQGLEEVVVVARRVQESLQNVPITVTAISPETLQDTQVSRGVDLIMLVPTLSVQQTITPGGPNYALRGIRDGVITYLNDVPVNTLAVDDQFWDLSSIQALAGPQGTLFGKTATGGVILFETQRPTKDFGGYVDASYGNYNYEELNAVVNLPVNDVLQLRFGARMEKHDPMVNNVGGGPGMDSNNREQQRVSILFEPTSGISNYTVFDHSSRNEQPLTQISTTYPTGLGYLLYPNWLALGARQAALGNYTIDSPYPAYAHADNYGVSNVFTDSLTSGLTFKYIFGYRFVDTGNLSNASGLAVPIEILKQGDIEDHQYTDEFQLLGKSFNDLLQWTAGYFDLRQHNGNLQDTEFGAPVGQPFSDSTNIIATTASKNMTKAGYAQATLAITDKLNLTAGARYNHDTASEFSTAMEPEFVLAGPEVCSLAPLGVGVNLANCTQNQSLSSHATTYNVSVDYHLSQNVMVYGTTRRGYNGGGFNPSAAENLPAGVPQSTYLPEFVTDYELGSKTEGTVAGMPVRADMSIYRSNYTQIQREVNGVTAQGQPYAGISNGPRADIYGAVLDLLVRPVPDFTASLHYGFLHTEYTEGAPGFPKGNTFGQAPRHTVNLSGAYHHDLPVGGAAVASVAYAYQSRITFQDANIGEPDAFEGGYGFANARAGWDSVLNSTVDLSLFVKNITNKVYVTDLQNIVAIAGFTGATHSDPRTYGFEVKYRFGK
jgi:iron complex outermembrane receptor protein